MMRGCLLLACLAGCSRTSSSPPDLARAAVESEPVAGTIGGQPFRAVAAFAFDHGDGKMDVAFYDHPMTCGIENVAGKTLAFPHPPVGLREYRDFRIIVRWQKGETLNDPSRALFERTLLDERGKLVKLVSSDAHRISATVLSTGTPARVRVSAVHASGGQVPGDVHGEMSVVLCLLPDGGAR